MAGETIGGIKSEISVDLNKLDRDLNAAKGRFEKAKKGIDKAEKVSIADQYDAGRVKKGVGDVGDVAEVAAVGISVATNALKSLTGTARESSQAMEAMRGAIKGSFLRSVYDAIQEVGSALTGAATDAQKDAIRALDKSSMQELAKRNKADAFALAAMEYQESLADIENALRNTANVDDAYAHGVRARAREAAESRKKSTEDEALRREKDRRRETAAEARVSSRVAGSRQADIGNTDRTLKLTVIAVNDAAHNLRDAASELKRGARPGP